MISIFRVIFSGILAYLAIEAFFVAFGSMFGFVAYHLNLSAFIVMQSFVEPSTIRMFMIGGIVVLFVFVMRKIQKLFS